MAKRNAEYLQFFIDGKWEGEQHPKIVFPPPIAKLVGFRVTALEPGLGVVEMETDPAQHANPMGTVHGGIHATIADAAIGLAHWARLEENESFTSIDLRINFFRPVWKDTLRATARLVNGGKSVSYYTCDITRGDGKLVAQVTSTVMTLRGDAASGR